MNYTCPCCGYKSLRESDTVCPLCDWKDDPYQLIDPDYTGGVNVLSLRQAQQRFLKRKEPVNKYQKDRKWCAFAPLYLAAGKGGGPIKYFDY